MKNSKFQIDARFIFVSIILALVGLIGIVLTYFDTRLIGNIEYGYYIFKLIIHSLFFILGSFGLMISLLFYNIKSFIEKK